MNRSLSALVSLGIALTGACRSDKPLPEVRVGYIPIAECLPLYVAAEMGYFEAEGIAVTMQAMPGGANILSALVGNSLDVGFSNVVSLVLQRNQGSEFFSLYGASYETPEHRNHALLGPPRLDSQTLAAHLRGAKIAVNTYKNIEELMVLALLEKHGLKRTDVDLRPVGFPQMLPALASRGVDIVAVVEPFITLSGALDRADSVHYLANHYLAISQRTLVATYVTSSHAWNTKRDGLVAFKRALIRATDLISSNEQQARTALAAYTKIPPDLVPQIGLSEFAHEIQPSELDTIIARMKHFRLLDSAATITSASMVKPPRD